jgi:DNA-binding MarR family transcriptional regulator
MIPDHSPMSAPPLPTLLSKVLVAFTVELDNEFERALPHRTTMLGAGGPAPPPSGRPVARPWTVSLAMWLNVMQFVEPDGVPVRVLHERARLRKLPLTAMVRWGYITIAPADDDTRPKPPAGDLVVRASAAGRRAQGVWRGLVGDVEERWVSRFGREEIDALREALSSLVARIELPLPAYLPILGYGLRAEIASAGGERPIAGELPLPTLLAQVLLAFTLDFERESPVSLAIAANVLRVVGPASIRVRDLPQRSGVSQASISMAIGFLQTHGYARIATDPLDGRSKTLALTERGREAHDACLERLDVVEREWSARFGSGDVERLGRALTVLVGDPGESISPLYAGLEPPAGAWRASVPRPRELPHHPMVLHRGGFPDGS